MEPTEQTFQRSPYAAVHKSYIEEVIQDLDRVQTCITIDDARQQVKLLKEKLTKKFKEQLDWSSKRAV